MNRWRVAAFVWLCGCTPATSTPVSGGEDQPPAERSQMECLATIADGTPFTFYFALTNPASSGGPALVPRVLAPLGAFVSFAIVDSSGKTVYESVAPKFAPKLDPASREAYVSLDPGYSYGRKFSDDRVSLAAGDYEVKISYSNLYFSGPADQPLGEQRCSTTVRHRVR